MRRQVIHPNLNSVVGWLYWDMIELLVMFECMFHVVLHNDVLSGHCRVHFDDYL